MKLTIGQALGTILNIQVAEVENHNLATVEGWFVIRHPSGDRAMDIGLGRTDGPEAITLDQAVWKAAQVTSFSDHSHFAVFPVHSGREDYYMAIERELLRQEQSPEFADRLMWQMLPAGDPRQLVEAIMMQLRECAQAVVHPVMFQTAMLRVGCLVVSCMQWCSDWIGRLNVQHAALRANQPEPPKVVQMTPPEETPKAEPVPPLFGAAGIRPLPDPVPISERKGDAATIAAEDRAAEQEEAASAAEQSGKRNKRKRNRGKKK